MIKYLLFCLWFTFLIVSGTTNNEIPLLTEQIGQSMFHDHKIYLIYVSINPQSDTLRTFTMFCKEENKLCTILSPSVDRYIDMKQFIGQNSQNYFAILDVKNRKKYVLPIVEEISTQDIRRFYQQFSSGTLKPYYASEQSDPHPYQKCQKVVGKDLDIFLNRPEEMKVLFLYTKHEACQVCPQMLQQYIKLAQKLYDESIVVFGYFDIFKNDHPVITDQILPYFLIFSSKQAEPFGVQGKDFHQLEETIIQIALKNSNIDLDEFQKEQKSHQEVKNQNQNNNKENKYEEVDLTEL